MAVKTTKLGVSEIRERSQTRAESGGGHAEYHEYIENLAVLVAPPI